MKTKKMLYFLFGAVLIPFTMGFSGYDSKKDITGSHHLSRHSDFTQISYSIGDTSSVAMEAAVIEKENQLYRHFYHEKNSFDERSTDSEELAQQLIDRALMLCHMSQEYWQRGELDKAIELLDQAYLLLLGINTCENEDLMQQKEDLRFTISKRLTEIYASREVVVNENQSEIPVNLNKQVQREIKLYTTGNLRKHFIDSYKRSGRYRPMILDMLKKEGLPEELSWLPLVESGFKVRALSNARALGLWQFIPSTGYKFGLDRNRYIDERLDPAKSTRAAIDYLKELHSHFGDWSTALAAYNCGETRIFRAIQNQKINYLDNFWDLYEHLPKETARYVPKFFAVLHIVKNLEKYGLDNIAVDSSLKFESLAVTEEIHLEDAAEITGIDLEILEKLNPELRRNIIPGGKYKLNIPEGSKRRLLANVDQIIRLNPASVDFIKHRVKSGETLSVIARRYQTRVAYIMLANNLDHANLIVAGEMLKIPHKAKYSAESNMGS